MTSIKFFKNNQKGKCARLFSVIFIILAVFSLTFNSRPRIANAINNLVKEGSFETVIDGYWGTWQKAGSARTYQLFRAYNAAFGYGSYSAAIEAKGGPEEKFSAVLASNNTANRFTVTSGKYYYLVFYAKATKNLELLSYLEKADTYEAITPYRGGQVTGEWQKFIINIQPNSSGDALLAFVFGDMPDGGILYLDGIQVFEASTTVTTKDITGYIGARNMQISVTDIGNFTLDDVSVELPYYDNLTAKPTIKRFTPNSIQSNVITIDMYERTFAGIGKVYVKDAMIGRFNYNVQTKINDIIPSMVRVNEDMTVVGSGFMPGENNFFIVMNLIDANGKTYQSWIKPVAMDSNLTQATVELPPAVINGNLYVHSSFIKTDGKEIINRSNSLPYKVKPVILSLEWSKRGYEHVGDKLRISGKGISNNPTVNFYDKNNVKIESRKAKLISLAVNEVIEVETIKKQNEFSVTVTSGEVESDQASALNQTSKPKITAIKTKYTRTMYDSNNKMPAAKIGEEISITGEGMKPVSTDAVVEFQGVGKIIPVIVPAANIDLNGASLKITVPPGAQNGYLAVKVNGQYSNYLAMEIVPTILNIFPDPIVPGENITISASGVGPNIYLATVYFKLDNSQEVVAYPTAIGYSGEVAQVTIKAPLSASNKYTTVNIQYDKWRDNGNAILNVRPAIIGASINMDTNILSVRGYGFSIKPVENKLTYKLADTAHTITNPKANILGIYPTEEGQEIKVQLNNDYYYGYVSVAVGEYISNEVNFGPVSIIKIARRVEYVKSEDKVMGVLYISGYNFGKAGGVKVGANWANVHYRRDNFIIAVISQQYLYDNPIIVTK